MEVVVTKEQFKALYFTYATKNSGWTEDYWNQFYEEKEGGSYFFTPPTNAAETRMFIVEEGNKHRMVFLTEEGEESLFDFPGKQ